MTTSKPHYTNSGTPIVMVMMAYNRDTTSGGDVMNVRKLAVIAIVVLGAMMIAGCAGASASSSSSSASVSSSAASSSASSSESSASSGSSASVDGAPTADSVLKEGEWGTLFSRKGDSALEFGRRVQTDLPVKAFAEYDGMAGGTPVEFDDPAQIRALFNALASANADSENAMVSTDDYTKFWFEFQDGTEYGFFFDSMSIEVTEDGKYHAYAVEGGADLAWFASAARASYNRSMR